nr:unnamed protein product [Digitaria exilis]
MAGGAGARDPLVASEIHGFLTCADLNFDKLMAEAGTRWFRPNEIYAVLANHARFKVHAQPIDKPVSGTVVLYDRKVVRNFRKDGHNWKKKKDGKTVQEAHEKLKIGNEEKVHVYYARGEDDPNFFRRCYWLLDKELERIVLVHYRQTSEESAIPQPHIEAEVAEVPPINIIHYTSPLTSTDSASARTELSSSAAAAAAPEEINSHGGGAISCETDDRDSSLESFWADLLESSMKNDSVLGGCGPLTPNQQTNNGMRDSGNSVLNTNATSNAIFSSPDNVVSEAYATNPVLNQVSESYYGALNHQVNQSPNLLTSDLNSQSKAPASSLIRTPMDGNMPTDVPARQNSLGLWKYLDADIACLGDNTSPVLTSRPVIDEIPFHIIEISSEWAYCTEDTKVLVVGYFHENYKHLAGTNLYCVIGFSLDFRDSSGWTALHWAAYHGREKMVAALLSAGANPSLVTDPTHDAPGGHTAADLAAKQGFDGLAAYLAEKGLTAHFEAMSLSKDKRSASRTQSIKQYSKEFENLSEQELCLRESLAAYRNAADAASNIQAALRERTLKLQTKAIQLANPEIEAATIVAAMKIQHAFRNYNRKKVMRAAARIQSHFRTWQMRRNFMNMRRQAIKIQAAYRGHQVRRQYRKVIWSVGVVEKAILRWRKKRKGLRGIATGMPVAMATDTEAASTAEEDYYQVGRQQAEDRFNRSVVRVQALFRSHRAQQEYRRMKVAHEEAKVEFSQK